MDRQEIGMRPSHALHVPSRHYDERLNYVWQVCLPVRASYYELVVLAVQLRVLLLRKQTSFPVYGNAGSAVTVRSSVAVTAEPSGIISKVR